MPNVSHNFHNFWYNDDLCVAVLSAGLTQIAVTMQHTKWKASAFNGYRLKFLRAFGNEPACPEEAWFNHYLLLRDGNGLIWTHKWYHVSSRSYLIAGAAQGGSARQLLCLFAITWLKKSVFFQRFWTPCTMSSVCTDQHKPNYTPFTSAILFCAVRVKSQEGWRGEKGKERVFTQVEGKGQIPSAFWGDLDFTWLKQRTLWNFHRNSSLTNRVFLTTKISRQTIFGICVD